MLKKIISGGQTGAARAALDFAIKHRIRHGGWVPKGRLAEDGRLPAKYRLWQMPTESYHKRTEKNVVDLEGTLIVSHGRLSRGSAYTRKMAIKHVKPCLHVDLKTTDIFQASLVLLEWIDRNGIKTLNVAGPRASKDPKIYDWVMDLLESALLLDEKREKLKVSTPPKQRSKGQNRKQPATVDEAVDRVMSEIGLRGLNKLARMTEEDLVYLHFSLGMWIRNEFVYPRNDRLLASCREVTGDKYLHWAQMHMVILRELWRRLQETHRLKVVK